VQVVVVVEELLIVQMFLCEEVSEFGLAKRLCHRYLIIGQLIHESTVAYKA
jgi:hypothetical protein